MPYQTPKQKDSSIPVELLNAHEVMTDEMEGVIDDMILRYEEAVLFANWAYMTLHNE